MALDISYGNATTVGPVALAAGQGKAAVREAERSDRFDLTKMQAKLQADQMKAGMVMDLVRMDQGVKAQQRQQLFTAQLQREQQQFAQQAAVQQQHQDLAFRAAAGVQDYLLNSAKNFAELQQTEQLQLLKYSSAASGVWDEIEAEGQAIQQALSEGMIDEGQAQQLQQAHLYKRAGFNPSQYRLDVEPGRAPGEIFMHPVVGPDGEEWSLPHTTEYRNGYPQVVLTDAGKLEATAKWGAWEKQQDRISEALADPFGDQTKSPGSAQSRSQIKLPAGVPDELTFNKLLDNIRSSMVAEGTTKDEYDVPVLPDISEQEVIGRWRERRQLYQQEFGRHIGPDGVPNVIDLGTMSDAQPPQGGFGGGAGLESMLPPSAAEMGSAIGRGSLSMMGIPQPRTPAEVARLPSGTQFLAPDGTIRIKP